MELGTKSLSGGQYYLMWIFGGASLRINCITSGRFYLCWIGTDRLPRRSSEVQRFGTRSSDTRFWQPLGGGLLESFSLSDLLVPHMLPKHIRDGGLRWTRCPHYRDYDVRIQSMKRLAKRHGKSSYMG